MSAIVSARRLQGADQQVGRSRAQAEGTTDERPIARYGRLDLGPAEAVAARYVDEGALPCVVFGVADASGFLGLVSLGGRGSPVRPDAIFFLASVTKAIVATAVMQYVDEGRLDLHAPLAGYLPQLRGRGLDEVTAWHVLTHTTGLPDTDLAALRNERPSYARSLRDVLGRSPAWTPGSRYEYNSSAWVLLSETIATLSGMPFPVALRVRLTRPAGMLETTFDPRFARSRIVAMNGFGARNRVVNEVLLRFLVRATLPGGGMFGTLPDLLRFGRALLPPVAGADGVGRRILSKRTIEEMSRLQTTGIPHIDADGQVSFVPQALGWRKAESGWPDRPAAITHGGISGTRLWVDPDAGLVFAFLTNLWRAPDDAAMAVLREVYLAAGSSRVRPVAPSATG